MFNLWELLASTPRPQTSWGHGGQGEVGAGARIRRRPPGQTHGCAQTSPRREGSGPVSLRHSSSSVADFHHAPLQTRKPEPTRHPQGQLSLGTRHEEHAGRTREVCAVGPAPSCVSQGSLQRPNAARGAPLHPRTGGEGCRERAGRLWLRFKENTGKAGAAAEKQWRRMPPPTLVTRISKLIPPRIPSRRLLPSVIRPQQANCVC